MLGSHEISRSAVFEALGTLFRIRAARQAAEEFEKFRRVIPQELKRVREKPYVSHLSCILVGVSNPVLARIPPPYFTIEVGVPALMRGEGALQLSGKKLDFDHAL
jgi:hypothetical protein